MPADTIFRETIGSGSSATIMDFIYDNQGLPFALNYSTNNGSSFTTYYYVLNLQGDVVKLVDGGGTSVASYAYDAWGKILSSSGSKAEINPLRYRGYYYDTETGVLLPPIPLLRPGNTSVHQRRQLLQHRPRNYWL